MNQYNYKFVLIIEGNYQRLVYSIIKMKLVKGICILGRCY